MKEKKLSEKIIDKGVDILTQYEEKKISYKQAFDSLLKEGFTAKEANEILDDDPDEKIK